MRPRAAKELGRLAQQRGERPAPNPFEGQEGLEEAFAAGWREGFRAASSWPRHQGYNPTPPFEFDYPDPPPPPPPYIEKWG